MAGKHHVVQGATVQCQFSVEPKTDVLKVLTQTKVTFNDKEVTKNLQQLTKKLGKH